MIGDSLNTELTAQHQEVMTAGTTIGAILGALVIGGLADRWDGSRPWLFQMLREYRLYIS